MHKIHMFLVVAMLMSALVAESVFAAGDVNDNYAVSNQASLGITKAFDDGQNTVVVFVDIEEENPVLTDKAGKKIRYQRVGDYAVLPGLFDEVHVSEGAARGIVKMSNSPSTPTNYAAAPVMPSAPAALSADTPAYKSGSAVYEIPYAKRSPVANGALTQTGTATTNSAMQTPTLSPTATAPLTRVGTATTTIAVAKPVTPATPKATWSLKQGYPIGDQMKAWGKQAHWDVVWKFPKDIVAPADYVAPSSDFETAAEDVIKTLAANGALIHYHAFDGNNTFLVYGTGASAP